MTFSVQPGEILLIAGASGCGKTTLIRCINGLIPRSYKGELQGRIELLGQDTAGCPWRASRRWSAPCCRTPSARSWARAC